MEQLEHHMEKGVVDVYPKLLQILYYPHASALHSSISISLSSGLWDKYLIQIFICHYHFPHPNSTLISLCV